MAQTRFDIIPAQDEKFLVWGNLFVAALTPELGIADDISLDLRSKITQFSALINRSAEAQNEAKQVSTLKKAAHQLLDKTFRGEIRRIKARADYTAADGNRIGIEAPSKSKDMTGMTPQLGVIDRTGGIVELNFTKFGSDGVNIYCQRDGDPDWILLGYAARTPFEDKRPLLVTGHAELRRYSAVYVKRRQEVGSFSAEVVIACAP